MAQAKVNPFGMTDNDLSKVVQNIYKSNDVGVTSVQFHNIVRRQQHIHCGICNNQMYSNPYANTNLGNVCSTCMNEAVNKIGSGCSPSTRGEHRWGIRRPGTNTFHCIGCDPNISAHIGDIELTSSTLKQSLAPVEKEIQKRKKASQKRKNATLAKKAAPYMHAGLAEPFAMAIARGVDDGEVMDLWESDWWKQYPADDELIVSVLEGEHAEYVARAINEFRGEHPELAHACVVKDVKVDWATMLLDAGFDEHPEAVVNVLCGGEPPLVARIRQMKVDNEGLPPGVGMIIDPIQLEADRKAKQEEE
jgi:hypothetical protein